MYLENVSYEYFYGNKFVENSAAESCVLLRAHNGKVILVYSR